MLPLKAVAATAVCSLTYANAVRNVLSAAVEYVQTNVSFAFLCRELLKSRAEEREEEEEGEEKRRKRNGHPITEEEERAEEEEEGEETPSHRRRRRRLLSLASSFSSATYYCSPAPFSQGLKIKTRHSASRGSRQVNCCLSTANLLCCDCCCSCSNKHLDNLTLI